MCISGASTYLRDVAETLGTVLEVPEQQVRNLGVPDLSSLGSTSISGAAVQPRRLLVLLNSLAGVSVVERNVDPLHDRGGGVRRRW